MIDTKLYIPNVQNINSSQKTDISGGKSVDGKEFTSALKEAFASQGLGNIEEPIKFSQHAKTRLQSRNIEFDASSLEKLKDAFKKAEEKGLDETLILTKEGAYIASVKNRTIITAIDQDQIQGSVFTNIDGAVFV